MACTFLSSMLNVHKWTKGLWQVMSFLLLEVFKQSLGHTRHSAVHSWGSPVMSTSQAFASDLFISTLAHTVYPMTTHSYTKCLGTHFTYFGTGVFLWNSYLLRLAATSESPLCRSSQVSGSSARSDNHGRISQVNGDAVQQPENREKRRTITRDHRFLLKGQLIATKGTCQTGPPALLMFQA